MNLVKSEICFNTKVYINLIMNCVAHIVFKFRKERIEYLKLIVKEFENYPFTVDVYIHCDKKFNSNLVINNYKNGQIFIKKHKKVY